MGKGATPGSGENPLAEGLRDLGFEGRSRRPEAPGDQLLVLPERIELSTSPLPKVW